MSVVVVVGAQWGDEGKGKIVDLLAPSADVVVRYGGGANAGHTLVLGSEKTVLHLVPSGVLHPHVQCLIGQGTVLDPEALRQEIEMLTRYGVRDATRLLISDRAFVVLPHHKQVDALREQGHHAIGTTRRGIGPAYEDKVARRGVRIADLLDKTTLRERLEVNLAHWAPFLKALDGTLPTFEELMQECLAHGQFLRPFVGDTGQNIAHALQQKKKVLLEGAQGTMLDIDHGTYPYVTSSSVIAAGACLGTGIGPRAITHVMGITKAYTTRVGSGPFPTELDEAGQKTLRDAGGEYGATTGRARRCGWLDIPALRFAVRINSLDSLAITKLDVLTGFKEIPLCVGYELEGERLTEPPSTGIERVKLIYETLPGWAEDIRHIRTLEELPTATRKYIARIEELTACPANILSVGADRNETISRHDPFVG